MATSVFKRVFSRKLTLINLPILMGVIGVGAGCSTTNKEYYSKDSNNGQSKFVCIWVDLFKNSFLFICLINFQKKVFPNKFSSNELKSRLSNLQYYVTQEKGTER